MTTVDPRGMRIDRLYGLLEHNDPLLATSIWHRVDGFARYPAKSATERATAADKLIQDLRAALKAAGVDDQAVKAA